MIKCIHCGQMFCDRHFPIHTTYYDKKGGALITEKDIGYGKPCIVCNSQAKYTLDSNGDIIERTDN